MFLVNNVEFKLTLNLFQEKSYAYCPLCENLIWTGWDANKWKTTHPDHKGEAKRYEKLLYLIFFSFSKQNSNL